MFKRAQREDVKTNTALRSGQPSSSKQNTQREIETKTTVEGQKTKIEKKKFFDYSVTSSKKKQPQSTFESVSAIVITEGSKDYVADTFVVKEKIETPQCSARYKYKMTQSTVSLFENPLNGKSSISKPSSPVDKSPVDIISAQVVALDESHMDDDGLCTVCYGAKANTVLLDCGHGGICIDCATDTMRKNNHCLFCRQRVIQIIEIDTNEVKRGLYKVINSYFVSDGIFS